MKLIIEPADGVGPLLSAIKRARKSIEIAVFRFDRSDIETALKAAAARGVRVTALIAFANRGGDGRLRRLESRFLKAGITVARTANDLHRYHGKYILIDRRVLYMLSFNFTHLDVDHSRAFGIVTTHQDWVRDAARLFRADSARTRFAPRTETFVVSPANSRRVLAAFLKRAKAQLLIYDPRISDKQMRRILLEQADAGIDIKVIGSVAGRTRIDERKLTGQRLHTRTIIRDRRQAFVGSQSLRGPELDSRRELGLIVRDRKTVKMLIDTFEADWAETKAKKGRARSKRPAASGPDVERAVQVFTKELDPLAVSVKNAVRHAVAKTGEDVLRDKDVKETMKKVVKKAVKEAVKKAVEDAQKASGR